MNIAFDNKRVSICIVPFVTALLLCTMVGISVVRTASPYLWNALAGITAVLIFWLAVFVCAQRKLTASEMSIYHLAAIIFSALIVGFFFAGATWGEGYLSLDPIGRINSGRQHVDNLYQSAIAESYNRSILPSALVNQEAVLRYHTFSCLAANAMSRIFKMPCFFVYSYLYPLFILPLYGFVQYVGISAAKKHFTGCGAVTLPDAAVVTIYNVGLFPPSQLSDFAIWKSSYVNSESFVTANTLAILFFALCFRMMEEEKLKAAFLYIGIPAAIFVLSGTKISVGCLTAAAAAYYLFRTNPKKIKYWLLNLYYLLAVLGSLAAFRGGSGSNSGNSKAAWEWFAFMEYCKNGAGGLAGHYLILSIMAIVFIVFDLKRKNYKKADFVSGKTVWVELIIIVTICSFLPGMFLDIKGGSAAYFSYFSEIPAMILLCGHGYLDVPFEKKRAFLKAGVCAVLFIWMFWAVKFDGAILFPDKDSDAIVNANVYESAMLIREYAKDAPWDFTIYLSENADVLNIYQTLISGAYIYPGLSGVGVINASYDLDGASYTIMDQPVTGYALACAGHSKLSLEEAVREARALGKKKLIHIENDNYEIFDLADE